MEAYDLDDLLLDIILMMPEIDNEVLLYEIFTSEI